MTLEDRIRHELWPWVKPDLLEIVVRNTAMAVRENFTLLPGPATRDGFSLELED